MLCRTCFTGTDGKHISLCSCIEWWCKIIQITILMTSGSAYPKLFYTFPSSFWPQWRTHSRKILQKRFNCCGTGKPSRHGIEHNINKVWVIYYYIENNSCVIKHVLYSALPDCTSYFFENIGCDGCWHAQFEYIVCHIFRTYTYLRTHDFFFCTDVCFWDSRTIKTILTDLYITVECCWICDISKYEMKQSYVTDAGHVTSGQ